MLALSKISEISPYSPEWLQNRLGKMTSSSIACLCSPKGIGKGGMTYIRNKVAEVITGKSTEKNITTEAILWGIENEPKAIHYWRSVTPGVHRMITDTHIVFNERFSSTPDALVMMNEKLVFSEDGNFLNCETLESKSYMTPANHMAHVECKTPSDIKDLNVDLYWQVISQAYWADVLRARAIFFHPHFPEDSVWRLSEVVFKKTELLSEFKFFQQRMDEATIIFEKLLNYKK